MSKPIVISGQPPKERNTAMFLAPIGMYCNKQLQKAENGCVVEFRETWKREKRVLVRKCKVNVNSSVFTLLIQSIYGANMRWEDLRRRWEAWAVVEGIGKDGFSDSEVLLLEVKDYDEETYKTEQERKRQQAEQVAMLKEKQEREAQKAHLLKLAKRGIYKHDDLLP